jgi:hypothetical protein
VTSGEHKMILPRKPFGSARSSGAIRSGFNAGQVRPRPTGSNERRAGTVTPQARAVHGASGDSITVSVKDRTRLDPLVRVSQN